MATGGEGRGGGLGYCVDCDGGAQLDGREALSACLALNKNDKSKCTEEWDAFQTALSSSRRSALLLCILCMWSGVLLVVPKLTINTPAFCSIGARDAWDA